MQARITAVQRALVLLPLVSLAIAVVVRPHPENRTLLGVLNEVSAFHASFKPDEAARSLRAAGEAQGLIAPEAVISSAPASAKLQVAEGTAPIQPLSVLTISNLGDAQRYAREGSTLDIGVPDVSHVGAALTWRLKHEGAAGPAQISAVAILPGEADADDIALEAEVASLQAGLKPARAAVESATKRLEAEQGLLEARRKKGMTWKIILQSMEARDAAKAVLTERSAALTDLEARYAAAVERATRSRQTSALTQVPAFALARVSLSYATEAEATPTPKAVDIPVRIESRSVALPPLSGASFKLTTDAGLWDRVSTLDPAAAVAAVRDEFNWHNRYIEVAGMRLGGMTLLQLLPCLLPLLTLLVLRRAVAAAKSYSLFGTEVHGGVMPNVGFKSRVLEAIGIVVLPIAACASAALALFFVGSFPALPALSAAACLMLGTSAYSKVAELQTLVASVVHSHSYPPPPRAQPRV